MKAPIYVDTSAVAKLLLDEPESEELREVLGRGAWTMVSSELIEVELVRAVSRADPAFVDPARELIETLVLLPISSSVRRIAGDLMPGRLRSLDAIHLGTALEIREDTEALLTYDGRLRSAASELGFATEPPAPLGPGRKG